MQFIRRSNVLDNKSCYGVYGRIALILVELHLGLKKIMVELHMGKKYRYSIVELHLDSK